MSTKVLEILEGGQEAVFEKAVCATTLIPFELELFGVHLDLCIIGRGEKVTLMDLVHPARQLCDIIVQQAIEHQQLCGKPVQCSAGCMACCKYVVTVSPAEALVMLERLNALPKQVRQTLHRKMTIIGRKIFNSYPSLAERQNSKSACLSDSLIELSHWYTKMNLTCPFIADKRCSYYAERPLVCREFLAISSPKYCVCDGREGRIVVNLPIKMSEVLMEVSAKLTGTQPQAMFLPLVPVWCDELSCLQDKHYNTDQVVEVLIEAILAGRQNTAKTESRGCF